MGDKVECSDDENDCVPLKLRRLKNKPSSSLCENPNFSSDLYHWHAFMIESSKNIPVTFSLDTVKNEDGQCDMQVLYPAGFALEEGNVSFPPQRSRDGDDLVLSGEVSCQGTGKNADLKYCGETVVHYEDNKIRKPVEYDVDGCLNDLDHIVLKERRRLLLSRKKLDLTKPISEGNCSRLSNQAGNDMIWYNLGKDNKDNSSSHPKPLNGENSICDAAEKNSHNGCKFAVLTGDAEANMETNRISLSEKDTPNNIGHDFVGGAPKISSNVKAEPTEYDGVLGVDKAFVYTSVSNNYMPVKSEYPEDSYHDKVDHVLLSDRIKKLAAKETSNVFMGFDSSKKIIPSFVDYRPIASESTSSSNFNRPKRKKRTVTDSIETALEEDAPGLLKVLIDKGVLVNEMKLYGVGENDEAYHDSLEESFSDLEAVMSKIIFQRQSFLKLGHKQCMKGEKRSYCLACLVSLVEQARYLQFRKWPVEWGWCRDLQSFIFVFERHHRIVLERPEYGYATYFFELIDSLSIDWQIKRLVTAMKLTSCGRITLIENRSLLVGEDLTEGEARVLMEYGWTPSSGLGTMLNYRDRVVHDRRKESDSSEWKSKIGKLLMDGYNGGTFVSSEIPEKVFEYSHAKDIQVKLEI